VIAAVHPAAASTFWIRDDDDGSLLIVTLLDEKIDAVMSDRLSGSDKGQLDKKNMKYLI
jgi:hypothetical protein